ncbi:class I lanthipeptide [uncultured Kordia sp.]|uniref:class I lanthipeptide n=1 Tax=uncultured Kordia sp. TaxID=507699 RepID=UPI0026386AA4|nr:class I lanthipeptide [uncultured Kordia sp.]
MKKKLAKLTLNKNVISNLDEIAGGTANADSRYGSACQDPCDTRKESCVQIVCITRFDYGFPCSWIICATPEK